MNYVRRSFGAMALTFCGMLSLHADLAQIVAPALDAGVVKAADLNNALKLVAARALREVVANTGLDLDDVRNHADITAKIEALKKASTDAQDEDVRNAGFSTDEIINIDRAVAAFDARIDALQAFELKLPSEAFNSVLECINAAKKVKPATMITVLKIAKYGTNDAAEKEAFLKLRDERKVNQSVDDILNWDLISEEACPQDFLNYIAGFNKNVAAKIPTMTREQAAHAHSFSLAQARIVARAARERAIQGVDCNAFDAQILQAKHDIKARFDAANEELVNNMTESLIKKARAKAAVQPSLLSKVWSKVPSMPKLSMPKFSMPFFGSKNGGAVPVIDYGVFQDISQAVSALVVPDATDAANAQAVVNFFKDLRTQAEAVRAIVTDNNFDDATQTEALKATVALIEQKYRACFADVDAVAAFKNKNLVNLQLKTACIGILNALNTDDVKQLCKNDNFMEFLQEAYNALF